MTLEDSDGGRVLVCHHAPITGDVVPGSVVRHHELDILVLPTRGAIWVGTPSGVGD